MNHEDFRINYLKEAGSPSKGTSSHSEDVHQRYVQALKNNFLLGFEKGDGATVVFLLVGIPTYYLFLLAYDVRGAVRELRLERKRVGFRHVFQVIRR